jgi:hypothetical protein
MMNSFLRTVENVLNVFYGVLSGGLLSNSSVLKSLKVLRGKRFKIFSQKQIIRVFKLYVVGADRFASLNTIVVSAALWETLQNLWKTQNGCGKI